MMSRHGVSGSLDGQLRFAISRRRLVELRYNDAVRVVEPHDYGIKNGSAMLLAYQLRTSGPPKKSAIGWRLFDVAKIADCTVLENPFKGSRGAPGQQHHVWDVLHARVE